MDCLKISKIESVYTVNINGKSIDDVSKYSLKTSSDGDTELNLTIKIPTNIVDISIGKGCSMGCANHRC